jgi:hypothetical protein
VAVQIFRSANEFHSSLLSLTQRAGPSPLLIQASNASSREDQDLDFKFAFCTPSGHKHIPRSLGSVSRDSHLTKDHRGAWPPLGFTDASSRNDLVWSDFLLQAVVSFRSDVSLNQLSKSILGMAILRRAKLPRRSIVSWNSGSLVSSQDFGSRLSFVIITWARCTASASPRGSTLWKLVL